MVPLTSASSGREDAEIKTRLVSTWYVAAIGIGQVPDALWLYTNDGYLLGSGTNRRLLRLLELRR